MNFFRKVLNKLVAEKRYLLEQKWGWVTPQDKYAISKSTLKKFIPANAIIIDCGAHTGGDSLEMARIFPAATIHAFEPVPEVYMLLEKYTSDIQNIKRHQLALSDKESTASMFVSSGQSDASSSLLTPHAHLDDHPEVFFDNKIEVKTVTLDGWAQKNKVDHVDFLWLDMQGFEYQMLQASSEILPTVKAIHTEVSMKETYKGCKLYPEIRSWLEEKGFCVHTEAIPQNSDMGNVLFVRK